MTVEPEKGPRGGDGFLTFAGWTFTVLSVGGMVVFNKSSPHHTIFSYDFGHETSVALVLAESQILGLFGLLIAGIAFGLRRPR